MPLTASILYRGPLSSCNYDCPYCPFAKRTETAAELGRDRAALARFVDWIAGRTGDCWSILFTPWGEALVRSWYREAIVRLSHLPQLRKVAIQTNLAGKLAWLDRCNRSTVALWCTYHPGEVTLAAFTAQCRQLDEMGIRYSVGCVGRAEHAQAIAALRRELPPSVYVWINAYKSGGEASDEELAAQFAAIDPLYPLNTVRHPSLGKSCRTGTSVFSVDGEGDIRRCHFVKTVIGNIYQLGFEQALQERPCPNATCSCHIGYVHLDSLELYPTFGDGVLERIPASLPPALPAVGDTTLAMPTAK